MGIPLADLPAIVPDIKIGEESKLTKGARFATKRLPEGLLTARITFDTVYGTSIADPEAQYTEPTAPPYPAVSGTAGAPFSDVNLKLAVMSALLDAKLLDLGTPEQLATHVLRRPVDLEKDDEEVTLLHIVTDPDAIDLLVRRGADIEAKDIRGWTPLIEQANNQDNGPDVVAALLAHGANPNATGSNGETPLSFARETGDEEFLKVLISAGAND